MRLTINHIHGINRREDFPKLIDEREYRIGIEIGVDSGAFSAKLLNDSRLLTLYGADIWHRHPDRKLEAEKILNPFGGRSNLLTEASPGVAARFTDDFFDFIYIDGNHHYRPVRSDINAFWPKLKSGGCLAGHDYVVAKGCGVIPAVNEFVTKNNIPLYTTQENGPLLSDQLISWFFFKP